MCRAYKNSDRDEPGPTVSQQNQKINPLKGVIFEKICCYITTKSVEQQRCHPHHSIPTGHQGVFLAPCGKIWSDSSTSADRGVECDKY